MNPISRLRQLCCNLESILILTTITLGPSLSAWAACSNPTGNEGEMIYNTYYRVPQFCDDTDTWRALLKRVPYSGGDCTNPTRIEGQIIYNEDDNVPQICIGGWQALGPLNPGAAGGGCSTPTKDEGTIIYNDDDNIIQYCNGSAWVRLFGPAPVDPCADAAIGDVCPDGSVYAGPAPTGNVRMYVTRCDLGQSWGGSSCDGTRSTLPYNNGNNTGFQAEATNPTSGRYNTDLLITTDSDPGVIGKQPYQAAQACADLTVHGHSDWFLPSDYELRDIYENLVDGVPNDDSPDPLITGFDTSGTYYRDSTALSAPYTSRAGARRFSDNYSFNQHKYLSYPIRCARR